MAFGTFTLSVSFNLCCWVKLYKDLNVIIYRNSLYACKKIHSNRMTKECSFTVAMSALVVLYHSWLTVNESNVATRSRHRQTGSRGIHKCASQKSSVEIHTMKKHRSIEIQVFKWHSHQWLNVWLPAQIQSHSRAQKLKALCILISMLFTADTAVLTPLFCPCMSSGLVLRAQ